MTTQPSVCIGMIAWRVVEPGTVAQLWAFARSYPRARLDLHAGDALVTRARSTLATRFLRDYTEDVLFTLDSDIVFDPAQMAQVAQQAHDLQSIVVGAYPTRAWEAGQIASILGDAEIEFDQDATPQPIIWGASGFMAIPRSVLAMMVDELHLPLMHRTRSTDLQYYPFYEAPRGVAPDGEEIGMSEDYDFCQKAASIGVKTYVNPAVRLGHMGTQMFRLEHLIWKQPKTWPLTATGQGITAGRIPEEMKPYARLPEEPAVRLNRAERRRQARELAHA